MASDYVQLSSAGMPASDTQRAIEALQSDVGVIGRRLNTTETLYLSGADRLVIPVAGAADLYAVTNTATAGSVSTDYHAVTALRSGQSEGKTFDTRNAELEAYRLTYLGTVQVGAGDVISLSLTVTGAPSPTLTVDNFTIMVALTPSTEAA